jgi:hypothetical protein
MGHFKIGVARLDNASDPHPDPAQGFDTYVKFIDDGGKEHSIPATGVDVQLRAGRAVNLVAITTGAFELDLPGCVVDLIRDPDVKMENTFDANRRSHVLSVTPDDQFKAAILEAIEVEAPGTKAKVLKRLAELKGEV